MIEAPKKTGNKIAVGFIVAAISITVLSEFAIRTVRNSLQDEESVSHSHQVRAAAFQFLSHSNDMLNGTRGYILTRSSQDLAVFHAADEKIDSDLNRLRLLIEKDPIQSSEFKKLSDEFAVYREKMHAGIELFNAKGLSAVISMVKRGTARHRIQDFESTIGSIEAEEDRTLDNNSNQRQRHQSTAETIIILGGLLSLTVLTCAFLIIWSDIKKMNLQRIQMGERSRIAALGEMAGGIAHEINNPLAVIRANAQLLRASLEIEPLDSSALQRRALKIEQTVQRIAKIVNSMLSFAHNGKQSAVQLICLNEIIETTLDLCGSRFQSRAIELRIKAPAHPVYVKCRPIEISQVLINLLNNSFDAVLNCDERWVELRIEESKENLSISVVDSGEGIAHENRPKVMQPFFTTKEAGRGTGLGLSVSRAIIESHGGNLFLNEETEHTCFEIHLPKSSSTAQMTI